LPPLREELRLLPADANHDGSPAWLIHDPVCNRFYRIAWLDFEILARWQQGSAQHITQAITAETTLHADVPDVEALQDFLARHSLLRTTSAAEVDAIRLQAAARVRSAGEWLLHHYLFFRVPLVRPQDKLARLARKLGWIFTLPTLATVCIASFIGIVLTLHQWDTFASSFVDHFTWEGALGFAAAVAFAKTLHEMGHALTATRYGVRVAHMGVAMVVMFPMLYTDTSESWKLTRAGQRLAIAAAGILTELALAGLASFLWALAPDGAFRTAMFFLASTSWLLTLAVNASPFMRFDGYFILCDLVNVPNLHERAGNFARCWLRSAVLGVPVAWPESLPANERRWLVAFALATWVYRLSVFLGIAVLVYLFAFKLLGIALMLVEVGWFIARPVYMEAGHWWSRRDEIGFVRQACALAGVALLLVFLLVPWQTGVRAPGLVRAERQHLVFSPRAGMLKSLPQHTDVAQGELLFALAAPELRTSAHRAQALADARERELAGLAGVKNGEERRATLESQRDRFVAEASLYSGEQSRMRLIAPFAGRLTDLDPQVRPGVWVQPRQPLAMLIDPRAWIAEVYVAEEDLVRIRPGDEAKVYSGTHAMSGTVAEVDTTRTALLPDAMLDASYGGPVVTLPHADGRNGEHFARDALFRVRIALRGAPPREQMILCSAVISGERRSLLHGVLDHALSVLIRESGF
jgi:putative peptide zinc metalloprotease protein